MSLAARPEQGLKASSQQTAQRRVCISQPPLWWRSGLSFHAAFPSFLAVPGAQMHCHNPASAEVQDRLLPAWSISLPNAGRACRRPAVIQAYFRSASHTTAICHSCPTGQHCTHWGAAHQGLFLGLTSSSSDSAAGNTQISSSSDSSTGVSWPALDAVDPTSMDLGLLRTTRCKSVCGRSGKMPSWQQQAIRQIQLPRSTLQIVQSSFY